MEVKEIKKEITLVFSGAEIKDLQFICDFYLENKNNSKSNIADDLADDINNLKI